jgi:hypothetical protein
MIRTIGLRAAVGSALCCSLLCSFNHYTNGALKKQRLFRMISTPADQTIHWKDFKRVLRFVDIALARCCVLFTSQPRPRAPHACLRRCPTTLSAAEESMKAIEEYDTCPHRAR